MGKILKTLSLLLLIPIISTCSAAGANSGFSVTLGQQQLLLINSTTSDCVGINSGSPNSSITAVYLSLQKMTVGWTDTAHPLTIQWVEFKTTDSNIGNGSEYFCQIAGTYLLNTWVQQWDVQDSTGGSICASTSGVTVAPTSVTIDSTSPKSPACNEVAYSNYCPFVCGGITMTNSKQTSAGAFTVEVYASYDPGSGNIVPLVLYKTMTYYYQGS